MAQKSESDSKITDSDDLTSVGSAEEEGSDEVYFVGFAGNVLEEAKKDKPSREEERFILLASKVFHGDVAAEKSLSISVGVGRYCLVSERPRTGKGTRRKLRWTNQWESYTQQAETYAPET